MKAVIEEPSFHSYPQVELMGRKVYGI